MSDEDKDEKQSPGSSPEDNSPEESDESPDEGGGVEGDDEPQILHSRFEEVNQERKELKEKLEEMESDSSDEEPEQDEESPDSKMSVGDFMKMKEVTDGLERGEVEYLRKMSEAMDKPPEEVREDENFEIWLEAKRERSKKDKQTPEPDTRTPPEEKDVEDYTEEDLRKLSDDELLEVVEKEKEKKL